MLSEVRKRLTCAVYLLTPLTTTIVIIYVARLFALCVFHAAKLAVRVATITPIYYGPLEISLNVFG
jgi:hypothetical protein